MKFGIGVDYSLRALLALAERYPSGVPYRVEEIAASKGIPENYLRRLLIDLKRGGLVVSQKGPSGGYLLARPPARISMADVVLIIEGDVTPVDCLHGGGVGLCRPEESCPMREVWREVREAVLAVLRRATLEDLLQKSRTAFTFQI